MISTLPETHPATEKAAYYAALIASATTTLWLVLYIPEAQKQAAISSPASALAYLQARGPLFYLTYANAVLITLSAIFFMCCLYLLSKEKQRLGALFGLVFVPIYGGMNLFAYGSQLILLPHLLDLAAQSPAQPALVLLIAQLTQAWQPVSATAMINIAAYAVLGIPSILFGSILLLRFNRFKWPSWLLVLNGIACMLGFLGAVLNLPWLTFGCTLGGILYLLSLYGFVVSFRKHST